MTMTPTEMYEVLTAQIKMLLELAESTQSAIDIMSQWQRAFGAVLYFDRMIFIENPSYSLLVEQEWEEYDKQFQGLYYRATED